MEEKQTRLCAKCNVPMEEFEAQFEYLGNKMRHKVPRCPSCGLIHLPEELVLGKMKKLEEALEEK